MAELKLKPKKDGAQLISALKKFEELKAKQKFIYPPNEDVRKHVEAVFDANLERLLPAYVREARKTVGALLTKTIPYFEAYHMHVQNFKLSDGHFKRHYEPGQWERTDERLKHKIRKVAAQLEKERLDTLKQIGHLLEQQAVIVDRMSDEAFTHFEEMSDSLLEYDADRIEAYISPAREPHPDFFMTCREVSHYLIEMSKGRIKFDALEIGRELQARQFAQGEQLRNGRKARGYYCKIVEADSKVE